jgi:hypothetical protein
MILVTLVTPLDLPSGGGAVRGSKAEASSRTHTDLCAKGLPWSQQYWSVAHDIDHEGTTSEAGRRNRGWSGSVQTDEMAEENNQDAPVEQVRADRELARAHHRLNFDRRLYWSASLKIQLRN